MRRDMTIVLVRTGYWTCFGLFLAGFAYLLSLVVHFEPLRLKAGMFSSVLVCSLIGVVDAARYLVATRRTRTGTDEPRV